MRTGQDIGHAGRTLDRVIATRATTAAVSPPSWAGGRARTLAGPNRGRDITRGGRIAAWDGGACGPRQAKWHMAVAGAHMEQPHPGTPGYGLQNTEPETTGDTGGGH